MHEDQVAAGVIHGNHFAFALAQTMGTGDDELAVFGLVIEVCHLAVRDETDPLGFEPSLQRPDQGVVLVVDGSLDARQSFNAGCFSLNPTVSSNTVRPSWFSEGMVLYRSQVHS